MAIKYKILLYTSPSLWINGGETKLEIVLTTYIVIKLTYPIVSFNTVWNDYNIVMKNTSEVAYAKISVANAKDICVNGQNPFVLLKICFNGISLI